MSRLEQLLRQYCPEGVEMRKLNSVVSYRRGRSLQKDDVLAADVHENRSPAILYGELYTKYDNYIDRVDSAVADDLAAKATQIHDGDILVPLSSTTKEAQIGRASVYRARTTAYLGGDAVALTTDQLPAYIMYVINGGRFEQQKMRFAVEGTTIQHLQLDEFLNIAIPVPPLQIQEYVVSVLDQFETLTNGITNGLPAEIDTRQKQCEYYRDKILSFNTI